MTLCGLGVLWWGGTRSGVLIGGAADGSVISGPVVRGVVGKSTRVISLSRAFPPIFRPPLRLSVVS